MDVDKIIAGLSEAQKRAVPNFTAEWVAGPTLPDTAIAEIKALEQAGILERQFGDKGPPIHSITTDGDMGVRLTACWHFRLTETGLAVRARLLQGEG